MPNALVNFVNQLDNVAGEGEDKREASLTADPYSDKVSSKLDDRSPGREIIHIGNIIKIRRKEF